MKGLLLICITAYCLNVLGQKTDKTLHNKTKSLLENFKGDAGVFIKNLRSGKVVN